MAVQKFRKKLIEIEALQWTGANLAEVQEFVGHMQNMDGDMDSSCFYGPEAYNDGRLNVFPDDCAHLWVEANTKWLPIRVGEWIAADPVLGKGYYYPIADAVMAATYEPVKTKEN
jgi:hypothetical protein